MLRDDFKNAIERAYKDKNITQRSRSFFEQFMGVNELPDDALRRSELRTKYETRAMLEANESMMDEYYIFHLMKTFDTKWKQAPVDTIALTYYKRSPTIQRIYRELLDKN